MARRNAGAKNRDGYPSEINADIVSVRMTAVGRSAFDQLSAAHPGLNKNVILERALMFLLNAPEPIQRAILDEPHSPEMRKAYLLAWKEITAKWTDLPTGDGKTKDHAPKDQKG